MFLLRADKNKLAVIDRHPITSGSVNTVRARFEFSADWESLTRTAVFRAGTEVRSVALEESGECVIPWEVLVQPGVELYSGVYGTRGEDVVLPTVWASLGKVLEGAAPGEETHPPTPDLWEQELAKKGDRLDYTPEGELGLYAKDKLLSAVPVAGGGDGVSDHRLLRNRDAENQHPIGAINGLQDKLDLIPKPVEALTNEELEALLK